MTLTIKLSALALLAFSLFAFTGCESHEIKSGADDVMDVMRNGVDVVTDAGNHAAKAMKSDKE